MTIQQCLLIGETTITSFTYVASNGINNSNAVTIPSNAQVGDLAIFVDSVDTVTSPVIPPTGWTTIIDGFNSSNLGVLNAYKIINASDIGATLSSTSVSTSGHVLHIAVFRPNQGSTIRSVKIYSPTIQSTTSNPTAQTLTMSSASKLPLIGFFTMCQRGTNDTSITGVVAPTNDGFSNTLDGAGRVVIRIYWKFYNYNTTPADTTGDIGDNGSQCLSSWYLTFN